MISEGSPGAAGEGEGVWQGCAVFPPGHSASPGGGVEVCPQAGLCWSALSSSALRGHRGEVWVGGCATPQPARYIVGDQEMSLQVQSKPQKPLTLQSI